MKIVWILGAGASKEAGYPLVGDFLSADYLENLRWKWGAVKMSDQVDQRVGDDFQYFATFDSDLNSLMSSFLEQRDSLNTLRLNTYIYRILDLIHRFHEDHPNIQPYLALGEYIGASNSSVITFNYDLLLEEQLGLLQSGAEEIFPGAYHTARAPYNLGIDRTPFVHAYPSVQYGLPSCGSGYVCRTIEREGRVEILKLHGSLGWLYCSVCGLLMYVPPLENRFAWLFQQPTLTATVHCRSCQRETFFQCCLVPPASDRRFPAWKLLEELWEKAEKAIAEADILIVAGYSLPPEDVRARDLLRRICNQPTNMKRVVVDPGLKLARHQHYRDVLGDFISYPRTMRSFISTLCSYRTTSFRTESENDAPEISAVCDEITSFDAMRAGEQFPFTLPINAPADIVLADREMPQHKRIAAANTIGAISTASAARFLSELARVEEDVVVRRFIVQSMRGGNHQAYVDHLREFLSSYDCEPARLPLSFMPISIAGTTIGSIMELMFYSPHLDYSWWYAPLRKFAADSSRFPYDRQRAESALRLGEGLNAFRH